MILASKTDVWKNTSRKIIVQMGHIRFCECEGLADSGKAEVTEKIRVGGNS